MIELGGKMVTLKLVIAAVVLLALVGCASGGIHETRQRPYIPKGATATPLFTAGEWFSGGVR